MILSWMRRVGFKFIFQDPILPEKKTTARPQGYKTFFMHNSSEHKICPANKAQITSTL